MSRLQSKMSVKRYWAQAYLQIILQDLEHPIWSDAVTWSEQEGAWFCSHGRSYVEPKCVRLAATFATGSALATDSTAGVSTLSITGSW